MSHEVEIKYRIPAAERQRLMNYFEVAWPATGALDLTTAPPATAAADLRQFLTDQNLWPAAEATGAPTVFPLSIRTWAVFDRYFFDYRRLLFRVRLMVDTAHGDTRAEITHKQADHTVGDAINRMEVNLPLSPQGVRDGDLDSVLKLMELMNFQPVLVMKKERICLKVSFGEAAPLESLLVTIDQVFAAASDPRECLRSPDRENDRAWTPLGDFVEVEAMVAQAGNIDLAGRVVTAWAERLDPGRIWKKEKSGYFGLATQKLGGG